MAHFATQYLTVPIQKRTVHDDGTVTVRGAVTDDALDLDGQIVDATTAAKALTSWFEDWANVRQQHSEHLAPAGKGVKLEFSDNKPYLTARIVEPTAVKLVKAGVYQAFSIGIADGRIDTSPSARTKAPKGIIYPSLVNEVSIVDYPANTRTRFAWSQKGAHLRVFDPVLKGLKGDALVKALSKRRFDPNVGGGVDRDKIPAADFAGKNRSFPIVTPGDVSDAASSIGRAGKDNYSPAKLRANITAIARRKGPKYVAQLPKKWREEMTSKKAKAKKVKKDVKKAPGLPFPGAAPPFRRKEDKGDKKEAAKEKKEARTRARTRAAKAARAEMTSLVLAHAATCPAMAPVGKGLTVDPEVFRHRLATAKPDSVSAAADAYYAARSVATLKMRDLSALRAIATKALRDAYPDLEIRSPDLSNPKEFLRPFLASATAEHATTNYHPDNFPRSHPLEADQFQRGPLVVNEARPTLSTGTPAKDLVVTKAKKGKKAKKEAKEKVRKARTTSSRQFYRNADRDNHAAAMAILHDHIASNYPSICPMSGAGAIADEDADRLGTPGELYAPAGGVEHIDTKPGSMLEPVSKISAKELTPLIDQYVEERVTKAVKGYAAKMRKMEKRLQTALAQPDPLHAANRITRFASTARPPEEVDDTKRERTERARLLAKRIHDRNSEVAQSAISELRDLVPSDKFAALMVAGED